MKSADRYPIEIFYSREDQCYIANVPDVKHCSASGNSREEALNEVQITLQQHLDVLKKRGWRIPKPSPMPVHA